MKKKESSERPKLLTCGRESAKPDCPALPEKQAWGTVAAQGTKVSQGTGDRVASLQWEERKETP